MQMGRMRRVSRNIHAVVLALLLALAGGAAQAQFTAAAQVGDRIVTEYEVGQRAQMLQVLGTKGDLRAEALERLIDERVQQIAVDRLGITVSERELQAGIEEFASRGSLSGAQFLDLLAKNGIARESFTNFMRIGLAWRTLVRGRFGPLSAPTEADIDRELGLAGRRAVLEYQFSELFLPMNNDNNRRISDQLVPQVLALQGFDAFEDAARRVSAAPSRAVGGRVENWVKITDLPPPIVAELPGLRPGQIIGPVEFPNALGFFQLRAVRENTVSAGAPGPVDYATLAVPDLASGQAMRDRIDTCDDLWGVGEDFGDNALARQTLAPSRIPTDIRAALDGLDQDEVTVLPRGGTGAVLVMLCARLPAASAGDPAIRDRVRADLLNRNLNAQAEGFLQELRAQTRITRK